MTTITQSKSSVTPQAPRVNIGNWLRTHVFSDIWHILFAIILLAANFFAIRSAWQTNPIELSFTFAPNNQPTAIGNLILTLTNGTFLTSLVVGLWVVGAAAVIYAVHQNRYPGPIEWLKSSLFTGFFGALTTLFISIIVVFVIRSFLGWAIFGAEFNSNPEAVQILRDVTPGAVWGIVGANIKLFAIGRYPIDAAWRVWFCLIMVLSLGGLSVFAWNFGSPLKKFQRGLVYAWVSTIPITYFLLYGLPASEVGPMMTVGTNLWGGFLLTIILSVTAIFFSFPIGLLLALGRRNESRGVPMMWLWGAVLIGIYWLATGFPSEPVNFTVPLIFRDPPIASFTLAPLTYAALQAVIIIGSFWLVGYYMQGNLIKTFCVGYIELIRGVPLITVLFMANIMLPIFLPRGFEVDNLLRVIIGLIMFSAAYLAENVRGGLQSVPKGQYEAAMAVGLSTAQSMRLIVLPQALRAVIPAIVGQFISLFKDTSLVAIIGLFDLLKIAQTVVAQPDWLGLQRETYAFVALIYWIFSYAMSVSSRRLEKKLGVGKF